MNHVPSGIDSGQLARARAAESAKDLPVDQLVGRLLCAVCLHRPIDDVAAMVEQGRIGSVLPGRGDLKKFGPAREKLRNFAGLAPMPLLYAADFEAGAASMVGRGATRLPALLALAAIADPDERRAAAAIHGRVTAREALALGVGLAFAPVADLADTPANPIINTRAPGGDPEIAAEIIAQWVAAAREEGLATTAKHFPGHGAAAGDSHLVTPVCSEAGDALSRVPLEPFRRAIAAGCDALMVAHVHYPALQPPDERKRRLPASLSPAVVRDLIRGELGFDGVVATDSLSMHAITNGMTLAEAAEVAIRAGNDLCLIESEFEEVHAHLVQRIEAGELDVDRVRDSAARVMALADRAARRTAQTPTLGDDSRREHASATVSVARRAVTTIAASDVTTALRHTPERVLIVYNAPLLRREAAPGLLAELVAPHAEVIELFDDTELSLIEEAEAWAAQSESDAAPPLLTIIVRRPIAYRQGGLQLTPKLRGLGHSATANSCGVIFLGSVPPAEQWIAPADAPILATWSCDSASAIAAAEVLKGESQPVGRLPMPIE